MLHFASILAFQCLDVRQPSQACSPTEAEQFTAIAERMARDNRKSLRQTVIAIGRALLPQSASAYLVAHRNKMRLLAELDRLEHTAPHLLRDIGIARIAVDRFVLETADGQSEALFQPAPQPPQVRRPDHRYDQSGMFAAV